MSCAQGSLVAESGSGVSRFPFDASRCHRHRHHRRCRVALVIVDPGVSKSNGIVEGCKKLQVVLVVFLCCEEWRLEIDVIK